MPEDPKPEVLTPNSQALRGREHAALPAIVVSLPAPPSVPRPAGSPNPRRRVVCEGSSESAASQGEAQEAPVATPGGASSSASNEGGERRRSLVADDGTAALRSAGTVKFPPPKVGTPAGGASLAVSDAPLGLDHSSDAVSVASEGRLSVVSEGSLGEGFQFKVEKVSSLGGLDRAATLAQSLDAQKSAAALVLGLQLSPLQMRESLSREAVKLQHEDDVLSIAFSPDGSSLLAAGEESVVVLWDVDSGARRLEACMDYHVFSVAFAPNNQYFAAGGSAASVAVWRSEDLVEVGVVDVKGEVLALAFASVPKGVLAVGTTAKSVTLISLPELDELADLRHEGYVRSVAFSPCAGFLAVGGGTDDTYGLMRHKPHGREMRTLLWQVPGGAASCRYMGSVVFDDIVHATAFSPSGKLLAIGGENSVVATLLVEREFEQASELLCPAGVRCLTWSPDSRFLASGGEDMQISVWDILSESILFQLPKAEDWYCGVAFSADCLWLATCGYGSNEVTLHPVDLFNAKQPGAKTAEVAEAAAAGTAGAAEAAATGPSQQMPLRSPRSSLPLASTGTVKLDARRKTCDLSLQLAGGALPSQMLRSPRDLDYFKPALSAREGKSEEERNADVVSIAEGFRIKVKRVNGKEQGGLVSRIAERQSQTALVLGVRLRPLRMEHCRKRRAALLEHTGDVLALAFSPDGCRMVAADEEATLVVWDVSSKSRVMEVKLKLPAISIAYSPSGTFVAAASQDCRILVWSMVLEAEVGEACVEGDPLAVALASSPTDILAVGTTAKKVTLLAVPDMGKISELQHDGHVHSISFSPDGSMLAGSGGTDDLHGLMTRKTRGQEMKALVWRVAPDANSCGLVSSILFGDVAHATTFSPSGKLLAVGGESRAIALLLVDRSFEKASELPCAAGVRCLSWSADSRFLASGGEDMQVSVWDIVAESIVLQMPRAKDWICGVAFSADSSWLATCRYGSRHAALHPIRLRNEWADDGTGDAQKGGAAGTKGSSAKGTMWAYEDADDKEEQEDDDEDEEQAGEDEGGAAWPGLPAVRVVGDAGTGGGADGVPRISVSTVRVVGNADAGGDGGSNGVQIRVNGAPADEPAVKIPVPNVINGKLRGGITVPTSPLLSMGTVKLGPVQAPIGTAKEEQHEQGSEHSPDDQPVVCAVDAPAVKLQLSVPGAPGKPGGISVPVDHSSLLSMGTVKLGPVGTPNQRQVSEPDDEGGVAWSEEDQSECPEDNESSEGAVPCNIEPHPTVCVIDNGTPAVSLQVSVPSLTGGKPGAMAVPTDHRALLSRGTVKLEPVQIQGRDAEGKGAVANVQISVPSANGKKPRTMALPTNNSPLLSMGTVKLAPVNGKEGGVDGQAGSQGPGEAPAITLQVTAPGGTSSPKARVTVPTDRSTQPSKGPGKPGRSGKTGSKSGTMAVPTDHSPLLSMGSVKLGPANSVTAHAEPAATTSPVGSAQRAKLRDGAEAPKGAGIEVTVSLAGDLAPRKTSLSQGQPSACRDSAPKKNGVQQPTSNSYRVNVTSSSDAFPESRKISLDKPWTPELLRSAGTVKFNPAQNSPAQGGRCSPEGGGAQDGGRLSKPAILTKRLSNASIVQMGSELEGFKIKVQQIGARAEDSGVRPIRRKSTNEEARGDPRAQQLVRLAADREAVLLQHDDEVTCLAFSPDGRSVLAAGEDKRVVLWDVQSRSRIMEAKMGSSVAAVAYAPSGVYIGAADVDGFISVWEVATHEEVGSATAEGDPLSLALTSKPRELLAVGSTATKVMLLSVPDMEELVDLRHDGHVHSVAFSPDGSMLAGGGGTDDMHGLMTRKADGREMKTVMWHVSESGDDCKYLGSIVFEDIVHATAFSPSGKLLAVGGENRTVTTFVVDLNFEKASEFKCTAGVRCLAWSSDSRLLAEGGENMRVSVWDVIARRVILQFPRAQDWLCSLAFSKDGTWLATCGFADSAVTLHPTEVLVEGPGNQDPAQPPEGQASSDGHP